MSLPDERPRTYVNGDPLIPDDINEVFDLIIALGKFLRGQAQGIFNGLKLAENFNIELSGTGRIFTGERFAIVPLIASMAQVDAGGSFNTTYGTPGVVITAGSVGRVPLILPFDQYQTITAVTVYGSSTSGALLELEAGSSSFNSAGGFSAGGSGPFWNLAGTPFIYGAPLWVKVTNLGSTTTLNYAVVKYEARPPA